MLQGSTLRAERGNMRIAIASIDTAGLVESLPPHPDTAPKCNRAQSRAPSSRWAATAAPTTSHQGRTRSVDVAFRDRPKRHIVLQQADAFAAQVEHHDLKLIGGADVRAVRSDGTTGCLPNGSGRVPLNCLLLTNPQRSEPGNIPIFNSTLLSARENQKSTSDRNAPAFMAFLDSHPS